MVRAVGTLVLLFLAIPVAFAEDTNFFLDHARGWHWFETDKPKAVDKKKELKQALTEMQQQQAYGKALLDQAVLNPTRENVWQYMVFQKYVEERSNRFSVSWDWVVRHHPELDQSLKVPSSDIARGIYSDQQLAKEEQAIATLAKQSGLFFFYRSNCPYCQRFAPVLKNFLEHYGLSVVAITTDGIALPSFPNSRVDAGQARLFHVQVEPALFLVTPTTKKIEPIAFGLVSEETLRQRILKIANDLAEEGVSDA